MTTATTARVSRETFQDRLRMANTTAKRYDDGAGITSSKDSRRIARSIENLVNRIVEDGIEYDDERDAFADFHNAILLDIDRQIVDFAYRLENDVRLVARAKIANMPPPDPNGPNVVDDNSITRNGSGGWNR